MQKLEEQLDELISKLEKADELRQKLDELAHIYPFNRYEFIISHLLDAEIISLEDYYEIRNNYIDRNNYPNQYLYEMATDVGEWGQHHIKELIPELQKAESSEYDFLLSPIIRIEVKTSRAVEKGNPAPLQLKALPFETDKRFTMNFQQLKPSFCDVFVWIAIWRDSISYWALPSFFIEEIFYRQHPLSAGFEGQYHITHSNIKNFEDYVANLGNIQEKIFRAYELEQEHRNSN